MPSSWIVQWAGLIAPGAAVLDVAAGRGRHSRFFADRGHHVTALDRDTGRMAPHPGIESVQADLVVTNYLHRPLFAALLDALAPGGVLLYETFMEGNQRFGEPSRPDFLLRDGELLDLVRGRLSVTAYEARMISEPRMAMVQRIAARRP